MRNRGPDPRRRKAQLIGAAVALALLLWALLLREDVRPTQGQSLFGWILVAAMAVFLIHGLWQSYGRGKQGGRQ